MADAPYVSDDDSRSISSLSDVIEPFSSRSSCSSSSLEMKEVSFSLKADERARLKSNTGVAALLTSSFLALQIIFQRTAGLVGLHAAKPLPLVVSVGLCATAASLYGCNYAERKIQPLFSGAKSWPTIDPWDKELIRRTWIGVAVYIALDGVLFRTVFPSSSIALGAYAHTRRTLKGSVKSASAAASQSQRLSIQQIGRRFGCHQCGSRQIFPKLKFISDHMPPTKYVEEQSAKWWRRRLGLQLMSQRLWPQCQSCFSVQGAAVRQWGYVPIYHTRLRLGHIAPVIAYCLDQDKETRELCDSIVDPSIQSLKDSYKKISRYAQNTYNGK
jgi:hypothetical protein